MTYKNKKNPEEYRRLAKKCREAARSVSAENERASSWPGRKPLKSLAEHCPAASRNSMKG